jgi:hypothetical protein
MPATKASPTGANMAASQVNPPRAHILGLPNELLVRTARFVRDDEQLTRGDPNSPGQTAHLPSEGLMNLRLVCRRFNGIATEELFSHLTIKPSQISLGNLQYIAQRPHLALHVKSVQVLLAYYPILESHPMGRFREDLRKHLSLANERVKRLIESVAKSKQEDKVREWLAALKVLKIKCDNVLQAIAELDNAKVPLNLSNLDALRSDPALSGFWRCFADTLVPIYVGADWRGTSQYDLLLDWAEGDLPWEEAECFPEKFAKAVAQMPGLKELRIADDLRQYTPSTTLIGEVQQILRHPRPDMSSREAASRAFDKILRWSPTHVDDKLPSTLSTWLLIQLPLKIRSGLGNRRLQTLDIDLVDTSHP